jgi:hypothetical protein
MERILFKKIYILPCPNNMGKNTQEYEDHISLYNFDTEKLGCIDYAMNDLNKKLNYSRSGIQAEVSTGIIVYEYFKTIKLPEDNIILVAFDSGVSKFHDKDWETQYFLNEINNLNLLLNLRFNCFCKSTLQRCGGSQTRFVYYPFSSVNNRIYPFAIGNYFYILHL